jgi:hypothetical protein
MKPAPVIAMDRRSVDQDGRLRVPGCRISKANVCPYYGREIPNAAALGLDPNRVYMLYRDPEELRKAAKSFEQIPLLMVHIPVTADAPSNDVVCGTVSNIRFEYPYLVGDVIVWRQDAIDKVLTEQTKELSSAYRYDAILQAGTSPEGLRYDIKMASLLGNHLALVKTGRAGPDVVVADSLPQGFNIMRFPKFLAALLAAVARPDDATLVVAADAALNEELDAMDELTDEEKKTACDAMAVEKGCAADALTDDDKTEAYKRAAADKRAKDGAAAGTPKPPGMDEAAVAAAVATAVDAATIKAREGYVLATDAASVTAAQLAASKAEGIAEAKALFEARALVAPKVGDVANVETAEGVFRFALDHLKVDHKDIPASALATFYKGVTSAAPAAAVALDARPSADVFELFPAARHISRS